VSRRDEAKNEEGIRIFLKCNETGLGGLWIKIFSRRFRFILWSQMPLYITICRIRWESNLNSSWFPINQPPMDLLHFGIYIQNMIYLLSNQLSIAISKHLQSNLNPTQPHSHLCTCNKVLKNILIEEDNRQPRVKEKKFYDYFFLATATLLRHIYRP
jgi:hypothetical protein